MYTDVLFHHYYPVLAHISLSNTIRWVLSTHSDMPRKFRNCRIFILHSYVCCPYFLFPFSPISAFPFQFELREKYILFFLFSFFLNARSSEDTRKSGYRIKKNMNFSLINVCMWLWQAI